MKLVVDRLSFNRCLGIVEKALPYRTTVPLLNYIYFKIEEEQLLFSATNLEVEIRCVMPYHCSDRVEILLPPKIIEVVQSLPDSEIELVINPDSFQINLTGAQASFTLYGLDPEEYPSLMEPVTGPDSLIMDQAVLKKTLKEVVFAASNDEGRPAFNGVLFLFTPDQFTLTASDTYRLAVKTISYSDRPFPEQPLLVPARSVRELVKILEEGGGQALLYPKDKEVIFCFDSVHFAARILEERFPDVSVVIPQQHRTKIHGQRKQLEETVARAALLAEGINQAVQFSVRDTAMTVRVSSQLGQMEEQVPVQKEGEDVDLYINSRFILDMLRTVDCENLSLEFNGVNGPVILRPADDETYLYLALPIKME